jgi:hypothetical protein
MRKRELYKQEGVVVTYESKVYSSGSAVRLNNHTKMKTNYFITAIAFLAIAGVAYSGFTGKVSIEGRNRFTGTPVVTSDQAPGFEYTPLGKMLRKANDFAQAVAAACGGSGEEGEGSGGTAGNDPNNLDLQDIADELDSMLDNCDFCAETEGSSSFEGKDWAMAHRGSPPGVEDLGNGITAETRYAPYDNPDSTGPGVNVHVRNLKTLLADKTFEKCNPGDVAIVAGIMIHEAFHALNDYEGHGGVDEQDADKVEVAFLCCAIDVIKADTSLTPEEMDAAVKAVCSRILDVQHDYCGNEGGTESIIPPTCDCEFSSSALRNWSDPVELPEGILDRLESAELKYFKPTGRGFSKQNGSIQIDLFPEFQELDIVVKGQTDMKKWTFDMATILGQDWEALEMESTNYRNLYFACRNKASGVGSLVHCTIGWTGEQPGFQVVTLVESASIGDVSSMTDISEYQDAIALYDYTNAKIWYVNILDGTLSEAASGAQYPDLWDFNQIQASTLLNEEGTEVIGLAFWLGPQQNSRMEYFGREESLYLKDFGPDGSIDSLHRIGVSTSNQ